MGDLCDALNICNIPQRIAQSLDQNGLCILIDGRGDFLGIIDVHPFGCDSVLGKGVLQQIVCAAVDVLGSDDVLSLPGKCLDRVSDGCGSGSCGQGGDASLQCRYSLFEHILCGIGQSPVNVSGISQAKTVCRMLRIMEDIGCGGVDRDGSCVRNGIRLLLSYVQLQSFKSVFLIWHIIDLLTYLLG